LPSFLDDRFLVLVDNDATTMGALWDTLAHGAAMTPFQSGGWLESWYDTVGRSGGEPMLVTVRDRWTERLVVMLPLFVHQSGPLRIVRFADAGVSDYNAPVLGPDAPVDPAGAKQLWKAIRRAVGEADLVNLTKMPTEIEGRPNPLALLPQCGPCAVGTNVLAIDGSWDDYLAGLDRKVRKEIGRCWRVFSKRDAATFRRVESRKDAAQIMAAMERQQRLRHQDGGRYFLDDPAIAAFYRALVENGIGSGEIVLTALTCGDEVVATLLGLARPPAYVMIRISSAAGAWTDCSPGRLVIVQTMRMLHLQHYTTFDFSIGDYPHKRRLGAARQPLLEFTAALSARGVPAAGYDHAKHFIRRFPAAEAAARRMIAYARVPIALTAGRRNQPCPSGFPVKQ
jgi:CelD/BcsL family acetyltransferase involved in cellulose biosynthesis